MRRAFAVALAGWLACAALAGAEDAPIPVLVNDVELLGFEASDANAGLAAGLTRLVETRLAEVGVAAVHAGSEAPATALDTTITQIGSGYSIDLTLSRDRETVWSGFAEAEDLDALREALPELVREAGRNVPAEGVAALVPPPVPPPTPVAAPAAPAAPPAPTTLSYPLELAVMGVEVCDIDGDGALEAVVLTEDDVTVHELDGASLTAAGDFDSGFFDRYVAIDCVDADGDGALDLAITNRRHGGFRSLVLTPGADGALEPIAEDLTQALRAVPVAPGERALHAQRFPVPGALYGPVHPARVDGGALALGDALVAPRGINVGALVVGHPALGEAPDDESARVLTVVDDARLRLFAGKRALASAEGLYGGYDVAFEPPNAIYTAGDVELRVHLRDRIELVETAEGWTLLATRIDAPLGNLMPRLELGRSLALSAFRWDGQTLRAVEVPFDYSAESVGGGAIVDLRVADWTADGVDDLVLAVLDSTAPWSAFSSDESRILVYPGRRP